MSIRVLLLEHSTAIRQAIEVGLSKYPKIELLGISEDAQTALSKIITLKPDVITIDLDIPQIDSLKFMTNFAENLKIPVILLSSLSREEVERIKFLQTLGKHSYLSKPTQPEQLGIMVDSLAQKVIESVSQPTSEIQSDLGSQTTKSLAKRADHVSPAVYNRILLIGASTGGTQAIEALLKDFPEHCPATLIVQHMPEGFTASFAKRLNDNYAPTIKEASSGEEVTPGKVLIAPGNFHLSIRRSGSKIICNLDQKPPVGGHRPSVDSLFNSAAKVLGSRGIGVILTGMGADGSAGLLAMKQAGAHTIAQNEETSTIFGMPKAAIECNAASEILPLDKIALVAIKGCQSK